MTSSNERLQKAQAEKRRITTREDLISEIHEKYSRFGERIVLIVLHYMSHSTGLRELVQKLPLRNAGWTDNQLHDVVIRFITSEGVSRFLEHVAPEERTAESSVTIHQPPLPQAAPLPAQKKADDLIWADRRKSKERRVSSRRQTADLIFKNKRYGSDRRAKSNRRKKQLPPPWKP